MEPNYYALIPANVRYDKALKPNAKLLYGEITALCNREGFCWAPNEYFAELYDVDHKTISRWISQLREGGYVEIKLFPERGNERHISIDKKVTTSVQKSHEVVIKKSRGSDEKVTPIKESITINNTKNKERGALAFLESEFPSKLEAEMMKYKTALGTDYEKFCADFDDTITIELSGGKISWDGNALIARLGKYARSWISNNQSKAAQVKGFNGQVVEARPSRNVFKG